MWLEGFRPCTNVQKDSVLGEVVAACELFTPPNPVLLPSIPPGLLETIQCPVLHLVEHVGGRIEE